MFVSQDKAGSYPRSDSCNSCSGKSYKQASGTESGWDTTQSSYSSPASSANAG